MTKKQWRLVDCFSCDRAQRAIDEHLQKAGLPGEDYPEVYQSEARENDSSPGCRQVRRFVEAHSLLQEMEGELGDLALGLDEVLQRAWLAENPNFWERRSQGVVIWNDGISRASAGPEDRLTWPIL